MCYYRRKYLEDFVVYIYQFSGERIKFANNNNIFYFFMRQQQIVDVFKTGK